MYKVIFQMSDVQHKEWFINVLLPHIRVPLMQQKIVSKIEALEIAMKLEASLVGEIGAGMAQIQLQLASLSLYIQDIKKGKEIREDVQCISCKTEDRHKDVCPTFLDYLASGAPYALSSQGMPWCRVFQTRGHCSEECLYLHKIVSAPASVYCRFFQSLGHDEKDYM